MVLKIAERIKSAREKNNLTQADLGKKLGVSRAGVNAWEMGISIPSTKNLVELTKILNVTSDYILGIDDCERVCIDELSYDEKQIIYNLVKLFSKNS